MTIAVLVVKIDDRPFQHHIFSKTPPLIMGKKFRTPQFLLHPPPPPISVFNDRTLIEHIFVDITSVSFLQTIWGHGVPRVHLMCPCNKKIIDLILITTEQRFQMSLNDVSFFSMSCFVLEIFRFSKYAN